VTSSAVALLLAIAAPVQRALSALSPSRTRSRTSSASASPTASTDRSLSGRSPSRTRSRLSSSSSSPTSADFSQEPASSQHDSCSPPLYRDMLVAANISLTPDAKDKPARRVTPRQRRVSDVVYGHTLEPQKKLSGTSLARSKRLAPLNLLHKSEATSYRDDGRIISINECEWRDLVLGNRCQELIEKKEGRAVCDGRFSELQLSMPEGGARNLKVQCRSCKHVKVFTNSSGNPFHGVTSSDNPARTGRGVQALRVQTVLSELLAGHTWESHQLRNSLAGMDKVGKESWYNVGKLVWEASSKAAVVEFKRQCKLIKDKGATWIASGDGAWTHRGHRANGHVYPLFNKLSGKIMAMSVLQRDRYFQPQPSDDEHQVQPAKEKIFEGGYKGSSRGN